MKKDKIRLKTQIASTKEFKSLKETALARANYKCEEKGCEETEKLEFHHVKPLYEIIKETDITEVWQAYNIPIIWDLNNYKFLCNYHHKHTSTYGGLKKKDD